ncbi:OmpW family protein [Polynucleobacter sp. MWH-Jannik1A5]|uniref:OmpW/AlkL family protein n=1 Tax=Polynucleobacter sp. MWH-Jannik1A5 TaxID=1855890 RepID=UPI001C0CD228|nr:OmpW family outer membrane protein [Polynucleobacter sp. MWH-Jannik1A5]MBU3545654.1 OmpW family protein [Polynucleobacter sp. MWH-Jannik1A5]
MRIKSLVAAMAAVASLAPIAAQAQAEENPWMLRVRAVYVDWQNGQANGSSTVAGVQTNNINASNQWLPEFDVSYFFTKNIATELVLSYPQPVNINSNLTSGPTGTVNALPPSLLLQYHFTDLGAFKPYIGAGINYTIFGNRNNFSLGGVNNALTVSQNSVGFVGQIGADYMIDKNWGVNVDLKYATMSTTVTGQNVAPGQDLGKLTLNPLMPAIGVTYKF